MSCASSLRRNCVNDASTPLACSPSPRSPANNPPEQRTRSSSLSPSRSVALERTAAASSHSPSWSKAMIRLKLEVLSDPRSPILRACSAAALAASRAAAES